jgi:hypothetical protein
MEASPGNHLAAPAAILIGGAIGVPLGIELLRWASPAAGWQISDLIAPTDYDALCAKLRRQRAAGGPVDPIPALPRLELIVENGVGRIVAAPGRCLAAFAEEEGIDLIPVAFRVVGGDGTALREIEDRSLGSNDQ